MKKEERRGKERDWRIARVVATGYPHHITQRGNRRQQTRPLGNEGFMDNPEKALGRMLRPRKVGRKKREK